MSTEINDGGPAFPVQDAATWQGHGMTLRDYFAAKAMQGDISSMAPNQDPSGSADTIAQRAYKIADAMLKARDTTA